MLIRSEGWAPILLVADLTYEASLLDDDILPGTGDATRLLNSYANVRKLRQKLPGLIIVPSHDFSASEAIAKATKGIEDTASFPLPHQRER